MRKGRLRWLGWVILVAAGFVGNYYRYPIFFSLEFIFGSVFAMLALQRYGIRAGTAAAFLISTMTYKIWNHPYGIVIMTCEVAVTGSLYQRRKLGLVLSDALYWVVLGMPLVYLFYHGVMHLQNVNVLVTMLKQSVNGIANALAARLLFMAFSVKWEDGRFSLREIVFNLLALFVLSPSLLLLAIQSRTEFSATDRAIRESLALAAKRVSVNLDDWLHYRMAQVTYLATLAETQSTPWMQRSLEQARASGTDFRRVGLLDRTATIIAYSPLTDELGQPNIGKNFADRPFIPVLKNTLKPMFSEVVMGRIGVPAPMVTLLAPVVVRGEYNGYVTGILNFESVKRILKENAPGQALPELSYTLTDLKGRVIVSSRSDVRAMEPLVRGSGEMVPLPDGTSQWIPASKRNISISDRWKNSLYVKTSKVGDLAEWTLVLEQPIAPFQARLFSQYAERLGLLLGILVFALGLGEFVSRRVIKSLMTLREVSSGMPQRLFSRKRIEWERSAILETEQLLENFKDVAGALEQKFAEVREMNATLEDRVRERTTDLQASEEKYRVIFENELAAICIFDLETYRFLDVNDAFVTLYGYSREELLRDRTPRDLNADPGTAERSPLNASTGRPILIPLRWHRKKDGTRFPVEIVGGPYTWNGRRVMFGMVLDISDRVRAEEAARRLAAERQSILQTATTGIVYLKERTVQWANRSFERMFGYGDGQSAGLPTRTFYADREE